MMIVTVFNYGTKTDVPVTPETTVSDIIECCRDPGDENCDLLCPEYSDGPLRSTDHPLEILQKWGSGRLELRYTTLSVNGEITENRDGMKEPEHFGETEEREPEPTRLPNGSSTSSGEALELPINWAVSHRAVHFEQRQSCKNQRGFNSLQILRVIDL